MDGTFQVDSGAELVMREGSWNNVNIDGAFGGSVMATSSSFSRLTLDWTGSSFAVFGMNPPPNSHQAPAIVYYYLDGNLLASQQMSNNGPQNAVRFFRTPDVPLGQHKFSVEYRTSGAINQPVYIDYFEVYGQPANELPTSRSSQALSPTRSLSSSSSSATSNTDSSSTEASWSGVTSSTSGTSRSESLTVTTSSGHSQSDVLLLPSGMDPNHPSFSLYARPSSSGGLSPTGASAAGSSNSDSGPPLGPIIGGVLGGLALIALLALLAVYLRKRRRERNHVRRAETSHPPVDLAVGVDQGMNDATSSPTTRTSSPTASQLLVSEKAALFDDSSDSQETSPSPPAPPQPTNSANSQPRNRYTMHSIMSSRTAGTTLPAYDPRASTSISVAGQPPAYQV